MKDRASIQELLNHFNSLINKLMTLDIKIDDEEKIGFLLYSMLDS